MADGSARAIDSVSAARIVAPVRRPSSLQHRADNLPGSGRTMPTSKRSGPGQDDSGSDVESQSRSDDTDADGPENENDDDDCGWSERSSDFSSPAASSPFTPGGTSLVAFDMRKAAALAVARGQGSSLGRAHVTGAAIARMHDKSSLLLGAGGGGGGGGGGAVHEYSQAVNPAESALLGLDLTDTAHVPSASDRLTPVTGVTSISRTVVDMGRALPGPHTAPLLMEAQPLPWPSGALGCPTTKPHHHSKTTTTTTSTSNQGLVVGTLSIANAESRASDGSKNGPGRVTPALPAHSPPVNRPRVSNSFSGGSAAHVRRALGKAAMRAGPSSRHHRHIPHDKSASHRHLGTAAMRHDPSGRAQPSTGSLLGDGGGGMPRMRRGLSASDLQEIGSGVTRKSGDTTRLGRNSITKSKHHAMAVEMEMEDDDGMDIEDEVGIVLEIGGGVGLDDVYDDTQPTHDLDRPRHPPVISGAAATAHATALPAGLQAALRHRQLEIEEQAVRRDRRRARRQRQRQRGERAGTNTTGTGTDTTGYDTGSKPGDTGEGDHALMSDGTAAIAEDGATTTTTTTTTESSWAQGCPKRLGYSGLGVCLRWLVAWVMSAAIVILLFGVALPTIIGTSSDGEGAEEDTNTGMLTSGDDGKAESGDNRTINWAVGATVVVCVVWSAMYAFVHCWRDDDTSEDEDDDDIDEHGRMVELPDTDRLVSASVANPLARLG